MAAKSKFFVLLILLSLISSTMVSSVQGHTAAEHMALIKENGLTQGSPTITQNDSVRWVNVDSSSNLTHRIVYDHDGDGLYNGTFDWDSGELFAECERYENNTKLDENCTINFIVTLDMNWTVGNYTYQDIRSDGSVVNATIELIADTGTHTEANLPAIGSEFGVTNDDKDTTINTESGDEGLTPEKMLLLIGLFTGVSSVILLGVLMLRRSNPKILDDFQEKSE